ncbi:MAG: protein translocase subunit SecF [Deltaproteobacteria bacterium]|nr:protein translocase subunit SecF [Deltaproteobacteria bacterium]
MPFFELVPPGTHIDFIGRRRICLFVSIAMILAGIAAVVVRGGVPMGIDFRGGTELQVLFDEGVAVDEARIREVVAGVGITDATVVRFGEEGGSEYLVKFAGEIDAAPPEEAPGVGEEEPAPTAAKDRVVLIESALRQEIGDFTEQRVEFVGPRVGAELREDGTNALLISAICILIYIAFRFSSRYAPGAILAVVHDLAITGGILVILGVEFDLRILAAMLAILGYSLNDTIIIYDRIRENLDLRTSADLEEVLNTSVNQTLSRTVLTSITTIVALTSLYVLGGEVIRPFALAMLIGVLVGTYSSVFIASPMLLFLERRYGGGGGKSSGRRGAKAAA